MNQYELIVYNRLSQVRKPETEYRFHPKRLWRFDFAYPDLKIAVEFEGAIWSNGRHNRGSGFIKDCEKYNEATLMGWKILRYTTQSFDKIIPDLTIMITQNEHI
jgi:very-short-patch-repair endonuclease